MFTGSSALLGATETPIAGTVIVAEPNFVLSAIEVAVRSTVKLLAGAVLGAVYVVAVPLDVAVGETLPHDVAEHDTVHVTPLLLGSLPTVVVNCAVVPASTVAEAGTTDTVIVGTSMAAEANDMGSATEVAVRVTVKSLAGRVLGAV